MNTELLNIARENNILLKAIYNKLFNNQTDISQDFKDFIINIAANLISDNRNNNL